MNIKSIEIGRSLMTFQTLQLLEPSRYQTFLLTDEARKNQMDFRVQSCRRCCPLLLRESRRAAFDRDRHYVYAVQYLPVRVMTAAIVDPSVRWPRVAGSSSLTPSPKCFGSRQPRGSALESARVLKISGLAYMQDLP